MTTEEDDEVQPRLDTNRPSTAHKTTLRQEQTAAVIETLHWAFSPTAIERTDAAELARIAVRYRFDANAHLLRRESRSDALWLVERGHVSVGMPDQHGNWRQTRSVGPGAWLDVASAWLDGSYFESAKATTTVIAHEFPLNDLQVLFSLRPNLATLFIAAMAARVKQTTDAAHELAVRDVPARLASWLLEQLSRQAVFESKVVMRQHKRLLASELGTSPETFSRALSRLRGMGFVAVKGYTVEVLDLGGLEHLAGRKLPPPAPGRG
jgi:CRP-like cAMP-binding protein